MSRINQSTRNDMTNPTTSHLYGGMSKRTGMTTKFKGGTKGETTAGTNKNVDMNEWEEVVENGKKVQINVTPKSLIQIISSHQNKDGVTGTGHTMGLDKATMGEVKKVSEKVEMSEVKGQTSSMQSQLDTSFIETSEDEEAKKKEIAKEEEKKKEKRGLSEAEKEALIDIELTETETMTLFFMPGIVVAMDSEQNAVVTDQNKEYDKLIQSKIGSDAFSDRAAQTFNLQQKTKDVTNIGGLKKDMGTVATFWDIDDTMKMELASDQEIIKREYKKSIEGILDKKLKSPGCLIDAEGLASHLSILNKSAQEKSQIAKGSSNKSKSGKSSSKINSSRSVLRETSKSMLSDKNSTSKDASQTNAISQTQNIKEEVFQSNPELLETPLPDTLAKPVRIIERLLTQSKYHEQQVLYKDYPVVHLPEAPEKSEEEKKEDENPNQKLLVSLKATMIDSKKDKKKEEEKDLAAERMDDHDASKDKEDQKGVYVRHLFQFKSETSIMDGRNISSMDWNVKNPDLLAVSYGEFDPASKMEGILAFWTLKNPNYPEKIITTTNSITCCQFSKRNPNFIAIGDVLGNIAIYDVKKQDNNPVAESKDLDGKHTDTIWEIQWVDRGEKGEVLVSISADGRIIEWSMKKGLEYTTLMFLKKQANPAQKATDKEGVIFIYTGGLSVDFPKQDNTKQDTSSFYFASTEDGTIHRCSVSYNEQYLETYFGHQGPIYKVRCNPFFSNVFLTCSYDWTIRLWNAREDQANMTLQGPNLTDQVNDIEWSPFTSTVFVSVANDGRFEIWDIFRDPLTPLVLEYGKDEKGDPLHTPKTCARFSRSSPVVATGNADGVVDIYRVFGLEHVQVSVKDQVERLNMAMYPNDMVSSANKQANLNQGEEKD